MIHIKTPEQIESMKKGGKILATVLGKVMDAAKPGVLEIELDIMAEKLIREMGGEPGFQKVPGYYHTICVSTNDVVVHGIPTTYRFKEGDIVGIDCGVYFEGLHTDMSDSKIIGENADPKNALFLNVGKKALDEAINQIKPGNHVGDISGTMQKVVEGAGYSIVRNLVGHGVGKDLHEEPEIPGFIRGSALRTPLLKPGMTIAVEVIYNMGKKEVVYANDEWTIKTKDGSLSGLFERTVLVTQTGFLILTK